VSYPPDLVRVAERVIWFEKAERSLLDPNRFLTYLMTYGTLEEVFIVRKYFSAEDFRTALENAPPGIFDRASWTYWNVVYGRVPVPPLPRRIIPD
jgi:hypothetical protein